MQAIFEKYRTCTSSEVLNELEQLINDNYGTKIYENNYIQIEYHNDIGQYKAHMLVEFFDKHREFYQYFLKKFDKIVISDNYNNNNSKILVINNLPTEINFSLLIRTIFNDEYSTYLEKKLTSEETLLNKEKVLSFLKGKMLKDAVSNKKIDFFKYLDLMNGTFVNDDIIYNQAIIELAFYYNHPSVYQLLDQYMNNENIDQIKLQIYSSLQQLFGLELLNDSLSRQQKLLQKSSNNGDCFLENNIHFIVSLFNDKIPEIKKKYTTISSQEKRKIDKETTLKLTFEFLNEIDPSNQLVQELKLNLENGKIILWDPNDLEARKEMQSKYHKKFDVYNPLCYFNTKNKEYILNLPLEYTLDDVVTLVHEFFHFHSTNAVFETCKSKALAEFSSIYFEMLVTQFLLNKGYREEDISLNFRIEDAIYNYQVVMPIMQFLIQYNEYGTIDYKYILNIVEKLLEEQKLYYQNIGLNQEEINVEFAQKGFNKSKEELVINLISNLNYLLVQHDEGVLERYPYLLGTILGNKIIEMGIAPKEMIEISGVQNLIEDPGLVLKKFGLSFETLENPNFMKLENNNIKNNSVELENKRTSA